VQPGGADQPPAAPLPAANPCCRRLEPECGNQRLLAEALAAVKAAANMEACVWAWVEVNDDTDWLALMRLRDSASAIIIDMRPVLHCVITA
jgi:hypothetical protein